MSPPPSNNSETDRPRSSGSVSADPRAVDALAALRSSSSEVDTGTDPVSAVRPSVWRTARHAQARAAGLDLRLVVAGGVGLCVVAVLVAALLVRSEVDGAAAEPPVTIPAATTSTTAAGLVVHAGGAVRSPGVYRLPPGSRVVDLLERAGGPALDLDLDRVNLAATLVDGQRQWFPRVGEAMPPTAGGSTSASSAPSRIDLNHATVDQLDTLPGIGPTLASAIVADRERRGPFGSVEDLSRVKGLTRSRIDVIRDLVGVG